MGKTNRQRRADKQRRRARHPHTDRARTDGARGADRARTDRARTDRARTDRADGTDRDRTRADGTARAGADRIDRDRTDRDRTDRDRTDRGRDRTDHDHNAEPEPEHVHNPPPDERVAIDQAVSMAVRAVAAGHHAAARPVLQWLATGASAGAVDAALSGALERTLRVLWETGWQPADVHRLTVRKLAAVNVRLLVDLVASQARSYAGVQVDPRWQAQLDELEAVVWWPTASNVLTARAARDGLDRMSAVIAALELLGLLGWLPRLEVLIPPPGHAPSAARPRARPAAGVDSKILGRVRGLLAKAESTTFPEEAEALSAKAQELMSRHAIDAALVDADQGGADQPVSRRVGLDDPYVKAKVVLLHCVAQANRCRSVSSHTLGFATVFGFESDLDHVELLYTSLLVQATRAMTAHGSAGRSGGGVRSFRQSFLVAYADRIGERLREATQAAEAAATDEHGSRLLPVLASRERRLDDAFQATFPRLGRFSTSANDAAGRAAGRAAAERANLSPYDEVPA